MPPDPFAHDGGPGWHTQRPSPRDREQPAPGSFPSASATEPARLAGAVEGFLLSRRVGSCSERTLETYERILQRFTRAVGGDLAACTLLTVQRYLVGLRERMRPITVHQHYRCLKTFFGWAVETGLLAEHPMRGLMMKAPQDLPWTPGDEHVRKLLAVRARDFKAVRNRALVALLADSALRISEALRLRIEDLNFDTRTLAVRGGKGGKDGAGFFGSTAATLLGAWLALRPEARPGDFVFCNRAGQPLSRTHGTRILHRLSVRAELPRKIGPHALRHYAATSLLRRTGDLELVRQVLRHSTLAMTLRYARLTGLEVAAKFQRASPLDALGAGR